MNNYAIPLIALGLVSAGSAHAQTSTPGHFFVKGSAGQSTLSVNIPDDNGPTYLLSGGYRWQIAPTNALGIEVGYGKFGKFTTEAVITDLGIDPETEISDERVPYRINVKALKLGLSGAFQFNEAWQASYRGGWVRMDDRGTAYFPENDLRVANSTRLNGYYLGAGITRHLTQQFSVGLDYDYFNLGNSEERKAGLDYGMKMLSASAEYRF